MWTQSGDDTRVVTGRGRPVTDSPQPEGPISGRDSPIFNTDEASGIFQHHTCGRLSRWASSSAPDNAVDGCLGLLPKNGVCMLNAPGPYATMDPNNPECWFIRDGQKRCYKGADVFQ